MELFFSSNIYCSSLNIFLCTHDTAMYICRNNQYFNNCGWLTIAIIIYTLYMHLFSMINGPLRKTFSKVSLVINCTSGI